MSVFFEQLQTFSERVFDLLGFEEKTSPWQSRGFSGGHPIGAILHYTAGSDIRRALRWFMQKKHNAEASAHVVVADGWPEEWVALADGLEWVQALPAAVVQCVPPDRKAWHATWTNSFCYGIEMVNAGELRPNGEGGFNWWPDDWSTEWHAQGAVPKVPVEMFGRYWEPYTCEQLVAVVEVLREVVRYHDTLKRYMVVGHENVVDHKRDPGPLFPIHGVRLAAFEPGIDPQAYQWFKGYATDGLYGRTWRRTIVRELWSDVLGGLADEDQAWDAVSGVFRSRFLEPSAQFGAMGRLAMQLLGYYIPWMDVANQTPEERHSIEVFQKMADLKVDGIPGIKTRTALVSRLEERGILT